MLPLDLRTHSRGVDRALAHFAAIFAALLFAYLGLFYLLASMPTIVANTMDDSAYYFGIARNVMTGHGLSFDGITATNGFHPLWLAVLLPLFAFPTTPETAYRLGLALQVLLLAGAAHVLWRQAGGLFTSGTRALGLLLFTFLVVFRSLSGLETAATVFMLVWLFAHNARARPFAGGSRGAQFAFGVLLGGVVLARLDLAFLAGTLVLLAALMPPVARMPVRQVARPLAAGLAGFALVTGPYFLFNWVVFGSALPISGAIKSSFPHFAVGSVAALTAKVRGLWFFAAFALLALVYVAVFLARLPGLGGMPAGRRHFRVAASVLSFTVVAHFAYVLLFMKWAVFAWYFVPYLLLGCVLACEIADGVFRRPRLAALRTPALVAAALLVTLLAGRALVRLHTRNLDGWQVEAYRAALWARSHTSPDARFAMTDTGIFGYFSERSVMNLDGVVNDAAFQDVLRDGRLGRHLAERRVRYLVQHALWNLTPVNRGEYDGVRLWFRSHRYDVLSDGIELWREDEVYRSREYWDNEHRSTFLIWRLPAT